jgi:transcriptional regulator with XRE-family HTH domain
MTPSEGIADRDPAAISDAELGDMVEELRSRAEAAEAELERTRRQLKAALGAGGTRTEVGVLSLGLDAAERARVISVFGENLNRLRARAAVTQLELAAKCFITVDHVTALGDGARLPSVPVLLSLARALDTSVEDLTDGLAPLTRKATREQLQDLLATDPLRNSRQLAEASRLPVSYVSTTLSYMKAHGECLVDDNGDWAPVPRHPTER